MEDGIEIPLNTRNKTTIWPSNPTYMHLLSFFFKYKFIYFNWRLIILQYCIGLLKDK